MTEEHPAWAVVEANRLLDTLQITPTRGERIDFICYFLRAAYHQGAEAACDKLSAKPDRLERERNTP